MSDSYNTRIKLKRDTEANWTSLDPVLLDGEVAIVRMPDGDTRKKIGDGTKKFSELPYDEIAVDGILSNTSTNPIQNKAVKSALDSKAGTAVATQSANGLMSKSDKVKLDGITGQVTAENLNEPGHTTDLMQYGAFQVASQAWVQKILAEIPIVDTSMDATSENPVQNKAVKAALDNKANIDSPTFTSKMTLKASNGEKVEFVNASYMDENGEEFAGIQLSSQEGNSTGLVAIGGIRTPDPNADGRTNTAVSVEYLHEQLLLKADNTVVDKDKDKAGLMSASDKIKLDGIAAGANKTDVDSSLSGESIRPVQNRVVTSALDGKMDKSGGTFTGNVNGKYFCGTWLQSTEASDLGKTPGKIAVLDDSGWVYYRTPSELFADLGITDAIKSYVDTAIVAAINSAY